MVARIVLALVLAHARDLASNTCVADVPMARGIGGNSTSAAPRLLVSGAELKGLFRRGGPVLALCLQRRCPLSRAFWPAFVATSERFPHTRFVAVDVEFEFSLNAQMGISAVPHVRALARALRALGPRAAAVRRNSSLMYSCLAPPRVPALVLSARGPQVIFATAIVGRGARANQLHVRTFPVGLDMASAEQRLTAFVQHHSGQLPESPAFASRALAQLAPTAGALSQAGHGATLLGGLWPALARREHALAGTAEGAVPGHGLEFEGFPEPPAIHWRLVASMLVIAGWAVQAVGELAVPCAPRMRELARRLRRRPVRTRGVCDD